jgi:hypothetical protein
MVARGEARRDEDLQTLTLARQLCRVEVVDPSPRDQLMEELRAHGCALGQDEVAAISPSGGIAVGKVFDAGQAFIAAGEGSLGASGVRLVLAPELCGRVGDLRRVPDRRQALGPGGSGQSDRGR